MPTHPLGELIAGFMVLWLSSEKFHYMHAARDKLELTGTAISIGKGATLAIISGPVSGYAGKRYERRSKTVSKDGENASGLPALP